MKAEISRENLEKATKSKFISTQEITFWDMEEIFGDKEEHKMTFDLYDGFGYCNDYNGNSYFLTYPRMDFVNACKTIKEKIREFLGLDASHEITVTDIVLSYCDLNML